MLRMLGIAVAIGVSVASAIYGVARLTYQPSQVTWSVTSSLMAVGSFAIPFALAALIALSGGDDPGPHVRHASWTSAVVTLLAATAAEFLTWRGMFLPLRGSSTAAVAFLTVPILSVIVAAIAFIVGFLLSHLRPPANSQRSAR
jgi:hypothetical protein